MDYNSTLRALLEDCETTNSSTLAEVISRAADETLTNKEHPHPDWFNLSKTIRLKAVATHDNVMQEYTHVINELVECKT